MLLYIYLYCFLIFLVIVTLSKHEDDDLDSDDAQEHGEWIYIRITYGWGIGCGLVTYVSQCRWVGVGTSQDSEQREVVDVEHKLTDDATQDDRHHGDGYAIEYPYHAALGGYGLDKLFACAQTYASQEDADTYLTEHQVGRDGIVGNEVVFWTEISDEDSHYQWTAGQTQSQVLVDARNEEWDVSHDTCLLYTSPSPRD